MSTATPEIWINPVADPIGGAEHARHLEAAGFDGLVVVDSQCIAPDPFVGLAVMAGATTTIGLGTGVSNPVTRHPAALAAAAASVAAVSGGRMVLGIGRGQSANFEIGLPPAPLEQFRRYLLELCAYARGEQIDQHGTPSSLRWLRHFGSPSFPIEVACTGPKIIAMAAGVADRLAFSVGADPERVRWAVGVARQARRDAGLDPEALPLSAYVQAFPHPDLDRAVELARGTVSSMAQFSGMAGNSGDGQRPEDREQFLLIDRTYEKRKHTMGRARHARAIDPDFVQRFAAVGPVGQVIERLGAVVDAGIDRLYLSFPSLDNDPGDTAESDRLLVDEVLPALRAR